MGNDGDDQEWQPKSTKPRLNKGNDENFIPKKISTVSKFEINFNNDKKLISGRDLNELIANIRENFSIDINKPLRLQQYFEAYQDWIDLFTFPQENTRLRIILIEVKKQDRKDLELKASIKNEINDYLQNPINFSNHMNTSLKHFVEIKPDLLSYFEASVHYIHKRNSQTQKTERQIEKLQSEVATLKNENEQLRERLDDMQKNIETKKRSLEKKCSIM